MLQTAAVLALGVRLACVLRFGSIRLATCACWRCHVVIGSKGVICEEKEREDDREGGQSTKKAEKKTSTHTQHVQPVPDTSVFA